MAPIGLCDLEKNNTQFFYWYRGHERLIWRWFWRGTKKLPSRYTEIVRDKYEAEYMNMRTVHWVISECPVRVRLKQVSALIHYLLALVMNRLMKNIQEVTLGRMSITDNEVLMISQRRKQANGKYRSCICRSNFYCILLLHTSWSSVAVYYPWPTVSGTLFSSSTWRKNKGRIYELKQAIAPTHGSVA